MCNPSAGSGGAYFKNFEISATYHLSTLCGFTTRTVHEQQSQERRAGERSR